MSANAKALFESLSTKDKIAMIRYCQLQNDTLRKQLLREYETAMVDPIRVGYDANVWSVLHSLSPFDGNYSHRYMELDFQRQTDAYMANINCLYDVAAKDYETPDITLNVGSPLLMGKIWISNHPDRWILPHTKCVSTLLSLDEAQLHRLIQHLKTLDDDGTLMIDEPMPFDLFDTAVTHAFGLDNASHK